MIREEGSSNTIADFRRKFVETASHEFRTPLTIIQTSCELLHRYGQRLEHDNAEQRFTVIYGAIRQMTELLDHLLEIEPTPHREPSETSAYYRNTAELKDRPDSMTEEASVELVSELMHLNAQLQQQNLLLQHLHTEKDEMVSFVVHELKNPLAGIMLAASLVERNWSKMSLQHILRNMHLIQQHSMRMSDMISRMLESGALEMGKFTMTLQFIDMVELARKVVDEHRERSEEKAITLLFQSFLQTIHVAADKNALIEIIENLLSNALKFSPKDRHISVRLIGSRSSVNLDHRFDDIPIFSDQHDQYDSPHVNFVRLEIQDEGPGVSEEDKRRLFSKFARLSAKPTGGESSTGLGLSIVKKLVEAMNGRIWCESEHGNGATFVVEFPVQDSVLPREPSTLKFLRN